jgi:serine/threonine protein kinase
MTANECLSDRELNALQSGTMSKLEHQQAADHLNQCHRCRDKARQQPAALPAMGGESWLEVPLHEQGGGEVARPARSPASPSYDFLAPPTEADELGGLAHYRVKRLLGKGGMGLVFLAEDIQLRRPVALKVITPDQANDLDARMRFLREARAAAAIKHPHVITIYQVGQELDVCYMAMEFLEGQSLEDWMRRRPRVSPLQAVRIGRQVAQGLAAAHSKGLIHRDLKPGNIWLEGFDQQVKLLDFGLVQGMKDDLQLTATGMIVGTPAYMAPEQARGLPLDGRCDLFSLGSVLYRLLSGRLPFDGETTMALLTALAVDEPPPLAQVCPEVPAALAELVTRLLAKEVFRRPATAEDVVDELEKLERSLGSGPTPEALPIAMPVDVASTHATEALFAALDDTPVAMQSHPMPRKRRTAASWRRGELVATVFFSAAALAGIGWLCRGHSPAPATTAAVPLAAARTMLVSSARSSGTTKSLTNLPLAKQMEAIRARLQELNPGFNPAALTFGIENGLVINVTIERTPVRNLSPLRSLPALRALALIHVPTEVDLATIKDVPLQWLDLNSTRIGDLSALAGMPLISLECNSVRDGNLKPLSGMKTLTRLLLSGKEFHSLAPLTGLSLEQFSCGNSSVADLRPLQGMDTLRQLTIGSTRVTSLAPLHGLQLTWLDCRETPVTDLTPLAGMKLSYLDCGKTRVHDLRPLAAMPLDKLDCSQTLVEDLTPLADTRLTGLTCQGAKVRDLGPLHDLQLNSLDCSRTAVSSLQPLADVPLMYLCCENTNIKDLTPLQSVPALRDLICDFKAERDIAILQSLKALQQINRVSAAEFLKNAKIERSVP